MVGQHIYGHTDILSLPKISVANTDVIAGVFPTPAGNTSNVFALDRVGLEVVGVGVSNDGGLPAGTTVTFTLQAVNSSGTVTRQTTVTVTPPTAAKTAMSQVLSSALRVYPGEALAVIVRTNQSTAVNIIPHVFVKQSARVADEQRQTLGVSNV